MTKKNISLYNNDNLSFERKLVWKTIQLDMKNKLGSDIFDSWLKKVAFVDEFQNYILLSVSRNTQNRGYRQSSF